MTTSNKQELSIRPATSGDAPNLDSVRKAAFAPVFASFRELLGAEIAQVTQARDDEEQAEYLRTLLAPESDWELYVAEMAGTVVGFVSLRLRERTMTGEIGLNAVHPDHAGHNIGTSMYDFALERMRSRGMRVATVSTGGDVSHAPARRAYEKAGFVKGIPSIWLCQAL